MQSLRSKVLRRGHVVYCQEQFASGSYNAPVCWPDRPNFPSRPLHPPHPIPGKPTQEDEDAHNACLYSYGNFSAAAAGGAGPFETWSEANPGWQKVEREWLVECEKLDRTWDVECKQLDRTWEKAADAARRPVALFEYLWLAIEQPELLDYVKVKSTDAEALEHAVSVRVDSDDLVRLVVIFIGIGLALRLAFERIALSVGVSWGLAAASGGAFGIVVCLGILFSAWVTTTYRARVLRAAADAEFLSKRA